MEPLTLFLDLDETLVKTGSLSLYGRDLFLGKARSKEAVARYTQAKDSFFGKDPVPLSQWASQVGVSIILSHEGTDFSEDPYITKLRPGAKEFLEGLQPLCQEINILTTGLKSFQEFVLELHQVRHLINNVYGREEINASQFGPTITTENRVLLVDDNCNPGSGGWKRKMTSIGVLTDEVHQKLNNMEWEEQGIFLQKIAEQHFICISPWQGDPLDTELYRVIEEIKNF